jgi:hypothetical protein
MLVETLVMLLERGAGTPFGENAGTFNRRGLNRLARRHLISMYHGFAKRAKRINAQASLSPTRLRPLPTGSLSEVGLTTAYSATHFKSELHGRVIGFSK